MTNPKREVCAYLPQEIPPNKRRIIIEVRLERMVMRKDDEAEVWHPKKVTPIFKNGEMIGVKMVVDVEPIRSRRKKAKAKVEARAIS